MNLFAIYKDEKFDAFYSNRNSAIGEATILRDKNPESNIVIKQPKTIDGIKKIKQDIEIALSKSSLYEYDYFKFFLNNLNKWIKDFGVEI